MARVVTPNSPKFYLVSVKTANYSVFGTGKTAKEAIDTAWKMYQRGFKDFKDKEKWCNHYGISEASCQEVYIGDGWVC